MKRIGTIDGKKPYDVICTRDNVAGAIKDVCKGHCRDPVVVRMKLNPEPYITAALDILVSMSFHYGRFIEKDIFERGKWRHLCYTRTFPDRVIQHAVMRVVAPILLRTCIADTYAAMEGRGIHKASRKLRRKLRADRFGTEHCLKIDVRHYFENVPRERLFEKIKRKLKCWCTLEILHRMIFECPGEKGILIGLYISQILSTFYLSDLDHYIKERLGMPLDFRYMDGVAIPYPFKPTLWKALGFIREFLERDGLELKGNWQVFPVDSRGIDMLGFVHRHGHTALRKRVKIAYIKSCSRIVKCVKHGEEVTPHMLMSMTSREGMANWCDAGHLTKIHSGRAMRAIEIRPEAV